MLGREKEENKGNVPMFLLVLQWIRLCMDVSPIVTDRKYV